MKGYAMLGIGKTDWIEKERPLCGPLDAIVRPIAVSPCTSDVHTVWEGAIGDRHNMILGHEAVGEVVEVGALVRDFKCGDRVIIPAITPDWGALESQAGYSMHSGGMLAGWKFSNFKDGVFAEYFHVNDADGNLAHLPEGMDILEACMLSDMMPTGFHGAELADVDTAAVDSLIDWLSQHGYYLIAEVPAFCDTAFALANSAAALPLSSGALWMDSNGCYWLDPASETVMIYLKQIARELSSRGFREVVFSEFRFPASNSISYHSEKSGAELTQDAAQELTTFFSGSNLMISFETDDTAFPADVCTGRLYIRDVDGSKIEKFAQAYGSAENLTELVFLVNSKDTRFDERAVLRPLLNS